MSTDQQVDNSDAVGRVMMRGRGCGTRLHNFQQRVLMKIELIVTWGASN